MHEFFFIEYLLSCKYEIGVFDRLLIEQNIWPLSIDASDDTAFGKGANAPSCNQGTEAASFSGGRLMIKISLSRSAEQTFYEVALTSKCRLDPAANLDIHATF